MVESKTQGQRHPWRIAHNMLRSGLALVPVVGGTLFLGMLIYHNVEHLGWSSSYLNAAMLLGGMGPVDPLKTDAAKLFASAYALFAGVIFLAVAGILFAPLVHRILHHFHLDHQD